MDYKEYYCVGDVSGFLKCYNENHPSDNYFKEDTLHFFGEIVSRMRFSDSIDLAGDCFRDICGDGIRDGFRDSFSDGIYESSSDAIENDPGKSNAAKYIDTKCNTKKRVARKGDSPKYNPRKCIVVESEATCYPTGKVGFTACLCIWHVFDYETQEHIVSIADSDQVDALRSRGIRIDTGGTARIQAEIVGGIDGLLDCRNKGAGSKGKGADEQSKSAVQNKYDMPEKKEAPMSRVIVPMEMPECCLDCPFRIVDEVTIKPGWKQTFYGCKLLQGKFSQGGNAYVNYESAHAGRRKNCPLKEYKGCGGTSL